MLDYYQTLGLNPEAKPEEVKRAFRRMAIQFHPDRNHGHERWATAQMKWIIEANRVLSDPKARELYDRKRRPSVAASRLERHRYKRHHPEDSESLAEQVLLDLLAGQGAKAVKDYEKLMALRKGFSLNDCLVLRDWVDAKFLIAEQYHRKRRYDQALALYEELYRSEPARLRYPHFGHEVRDRILRICTRDAAADATPFAAAQYYLRALALELSKVQRAYIHKKLAEVHLAVGDVEAARRYLEIAFELKPTLKGTLKICRKLGLERRPAGPDRRR